MVHGILIAVYVLGAALEILGLLLTISVIIRDNKDGTLSIDYPESCPPPSRN
jgi:hypothetical protein